MKSLINRGARTLVEVVRYAADVTLRVAPWATLAIWPPYFAYLAANAEAIAAHKHYGYQAVEAMQAVGGFGAAISVLWVGYALLPAGWRCISAIVAVAIAMVPLQAAISPGDRGAPPAALSDAPALERTAGAFATPAAPVELGWDPDGETTGRDEWSRRIPRVDKVATISRRGLDRVNRSTTERISELVTYSGNTRVHHAAVEDELFRRSYSSIHSDVRCHALTEQLAGTLSRMNEDMAPILDRWERQLSELSQKVRALPFEKLGELRP